MQISDRNPRVAQFSDEELDFDPPQQPGMYDPAARLVDMDLEGIDMAVLFPPGSGEEWAMDDPAFSIALCHTLNDARASYAAHAPDRLRLVAKLPMIEPKAAAEELERCVSEHPGLFVGLVTTQHVRERNLDHADFDVVWETAQRLDVAVTVHGGGQAPGQVPIAIDRYTTRLEKHAVTHPFGAMLAVMAFTVGGIFARFDRLRVAFLEAGAGWLPFWMERLDEHWEALPDQAPMIDRAPSSYAEGRCFVSFEPDERAVPYVLGAGGWPSSVCYASDYCHWDCKFPDSVRLIAERTDLSDEDKRGLFADNARLLYRL